MATDELTVCDPGRAEAEAFVARHFSQLISTDAESNSSDVFRGGQSYANKAWSALDLSDYTRSRTQAYPERRRGASRLSPYIRHGLVDLPTLWGQIEGPTAEVERFRLELLWQEYARHLYARLGPAMKNPLRYQPASGAGKQSSWDESMGCVEITTGELEDDGWLVGQARLWLASQWTVRQGGDWHDGEDYFFRHLIDGSRAANLLGWQTAIGSINGRPYNFTRWQVESRAPGLCASCDRNTDCPIDRWPDRHQTPVALNNKMLTSDPDLDRTAGPAEPSVAFGATSDGVLPDAIWITAESMGDADPALAAHPDLPAVFVFDRPLLSKLRLSSKRLVFMVETLADLATRRPVEIHLGTPSEALVDRRAAVTFAPVPGWRRQAAQVDPTLVYPWPWLRRPGNGDLGTFAQWFDQTVESSVPGEHCSPDLPSPARPAQRSVADAIPVEAKLM